MKLNSHAFSCLQGHIPPSCSTLGSSHACASFHGATASHRTTRPDVHGSPVRCAGLYDSRKQTVSQTTILTSSCFVDCRCSRQSLALWTRLQHRRLQRTACVVHHHTSSCCLILECEAMHFAAFQCGLTALGHLLTALLHRRS